MDMAEQVRQKSIVIEGDGGRVEIQSAPDGKVAISVTSPLDNNGEGHITISVTDYPMVDGDDIVCKDKRAMVEFRRAKKFSEGGYFVRGHHEIVPTKIEPIIYLTRTQALQIIDALP
jgi:hypothetical protein